MSFRTRAPTREPGNHENRAANNWQSRVFIGSGPGPAARPETTAWYSNQFPYSLDGRRVVAGGPLSQQLPLFCRLITQRFEKPRLRGRGAVPIADAEFLELRGVAREGAVVERDREADIAAVAHGGADAVDRGDELRVVGMAADAERVRQVGGTDRESLGTRLSELRTCGRGPGW
jgi:hypothetical protein